MDLIEEAINQNTVKRFKQFTAWATEVQKKPRPQKPLEKRKRKKQKASVDGESSLVAAIR